MRFECVRAVLRSVLPGAAATAAADALLCISCSGGDDLYRSIERLRSVLRHSGLSIVRLECVRTILWSVLPGTAAAAAAAAAATTAAPALLRLLSVSYGTGADLHRPNEQLWGVLRHSE